MTTVKQNDPMGHWSMGSFCLERVLFTPTLCQESRDGIGIRFSLELFELKFKDHDASPISVDENFYLLALGEKVPGDEGAVVGNE